MEDFQLDIVVGKGASAQSIRIDLARFTLVGATTRMGKVTAPLRDRFGIADKLDYYQPDELEQISEPCRRDPRRRPHPRGAEVIGTKEAGGHHASPSVSSPGCATMPSPAPGGVGRRRHRRDRSGGIRGRSSRTRQGGRRHSRGAGGPLLRPPGRDCPHWRRPSRRSRKQLRTPTSPTCCRSGCCSAHRGSGRHSVCVESFGADPASRGAGKPALDSYARRVRTAELDYELPEAAIAQHPVEPRHASRLLDTAI